MGGRDQDRKGVGGGLCALEHICFLPVGLRLGPRLCCPQVHTLPVSSTGRWGAPTHGAFSQEGAL